MKDKVSLVGAGGHARSVINLLKLNNITISGIFDDSFSAQKSEAICGFPLKGSLNDIALPCSVVLAVGDNKKRHEFYIRFKEHILELNVIHPKATIEESAKIGKSNLIFAGAYINAEAQIGTNNIINTHAVIEHESKIGNNNHISIGALVCGRVTIGNQCFIGAGATIIDKITIADDVTVGANSVVVKDIIEKGVYVGNPARKISD